MVFEVMFGCQQNLWEKKAKIKQKHPWADIEKRHIFGKIVSLAPTQVLDNTKPYLHQTAHQSWDHNKLV
jgi:hypothetical protein